MLLFRTANGNVASSNPTTGSLQVIGGVLIFSYCPTTFIVGAGISGTLNSGSAAVLTSCFQ